jgi:hypothetical protein
MTEITIYCNRENLTAIRQVIKDCDTFFTVRITRVYSVEGGQPWHRHITLESPDAEDFYYLGRNVQRVLTYNKTVKG